MTTQHPPDLPDDPRQILGDELWEHLEPSAMPDPPAGFDQRFRQRLHAPPRRRLWAAAGVTASVVALAAGVLLVTLPPGDEPTSAAVENDLALVADLELMENLELLEDLEILMAWDGRAP